jgi:RES domain-containing protein
VIAYRNSDYLTPLRTDTQSQRRPGRYHRGTEAEPTQYLSLHPLGPHAEAMRRLDARTPERARALDLRTWALEIPGDGLVEVEFSEQWVDDDWSACQDLGDVLRESGAPGAIVPSAALPGTRNVVLFGPRSALPYLWQPLRPADVPTSITGEHGSALESLVTCVRFRGGPHPGDIVFDEPDWSYAAA